jgi:hypothetical protein
VLTRRLRQEHDPGSTLVRNELGLCLGEARVDVAVINGSLVGYEIKTANDRLDRLAGQVKLYSKVLDQVVLVVATRHLSRALSLVPDWWGIWQIDQLDGDVSFAPLRSPSYNSATSPLSVAQLLWRDEALVLLAERSLDRGLRTATRWRLWEALVEHLEADDLGLEVCRRLRARRDWPGG